MDVDLYSENAIGKYKRNVYIIGLVLLPGKIEKNKG